jgi:Na+-driven multidrug efflux pump
LGLLALTWLGAWTAFFSANPAVHLAAVSYLGVAALAYPFLGMGLTMASTFQAVGRPIWPLLATASRVLVVAGGGWIAIHAIGTGLAGLGVVAATGLVVYGTTLATAFRLRAARG